MKELKQWLLCDPAVSKKPLGANGKAVEWMDSEKGRTEDQAKAAVENHIASNIGFVFTAGDPYLVIDLDNKENNNEVQTYIDEVANGTFPAVEHTFS